MAAIEGLRELIGDVIADMATTRKPVPEPLADRRFSGEFVARVPSALHRRLAIEAAQAGVSLNRLVSLKLAMPLGTPAPQPRAARRRAKTGAAR